MTNDEAYEIARRYHDARSMNDAAALLPLFSDTVDYATVGTPRDNSVAFRSGGERTADIAELYVQEWHWKDYRLGPVLGNGDLVVARATVSLLHVPTGREIETEIVDYMRVDGGRITAMEEFVDTALLGAVRAGLD